VVTCSQATHAEEKITPLAAARSALEFFARPLAFGVGKLQFAGDTRVLVNHWRAVTPANMLPLFDSSSRLAKLRRAGTLQNVRFRASAIVRGST
jgi:hypothetical protein